MFAQVSVVESGVLRLQEPELASFDWRVLVVTGVAALALLRLRIGIPATLAVSAALGLALSFVG